MPWSCPREVEVALWAAAGERIPPHRLEAAALESAVIGRSRLYTSERAELATPLDDPSDLAARALFFTIADAPKATFALAELAGRGLLPASSPLRLLDLGAGAGAMTFGVWAYLRGAGDERRLEVTAVDRDREALAIMQEAAATLDPDGLAVTTRVADFGAREALDARDTFDLAIAGTTLNELPPAARRGVADLALSSITPEGAVILIEPALREQARALHELRDQLLADRAAFVFAPCTRTGTPCPALADPDDWCHEDRPAALPSRAAAIARATGLRQHGIKLAYLTLRHASADQVPPPEPPLVPLRVVSHPRRTKGVRETFLCGDAGRHRVRLLKRHRSPANRAFEDADRGDVLVMPASTDISATDPIVRHRVDHRR